MVSYKDYVAGWYDSSIDEFLEEIRWAFTSMKFALITCLDSDQHPASLVKRSPFLRSVEDELTTLGQGLLLPARLLLANQAYKELFFGFDEIWFFPEEISEPKPGSAWLVGPAKIDQSELDAVGEWMMRNSCSLGLGDGCGLNYVVKARGLVRHLLSHSLRQPPRGSAPVGSPVDLSS